MKVGRQEKILELIGRSRIETQEELCARLNESGFNVTQATVSRDIRNLKLTKLTAPDGRQYYALTPGETDYSQKYLNILKDGFLSAEAAASIVVIHTISGMAMPVAAAVDAIGLEEIAGCVAGDDTVMAAAYSVKEAGTAAEKLTELATGKYSYAP